MSLFFSQCLKAALQNQGVPTSQPPKDHTITDFRFVSFLLQTSVPFAYN